MNISKRKLPLRGEIQVVSGLLVFAVFSWSIRGFLYKLSAFLLYDDLGEIFGIFSYMMGIALLESGIIMLVLLSLAVILPKGWFRTGFGYKASLLVLVAGGAMIYLQSILTFRFPSVRTLVLFLAIPLAVWIVLLILATKVKPFRVVLDFILDRVSVFLYLYVPLGIIGLVVVAFRNLF
ncbi:MAG: hypothetical protein PVJ21_13135 [Anaerolineales bacterium]|jgi:hypothetical protein